MLFILIETPYNAAHWITGSACSRKPIWPFKEAISNKEDGIL